MIGSIAGMKSVDDLHLEIDRVNALLRTSNRLSEAIELRARIVGFARISRQSRRLGLICFDPNKEMDVPGTENTHFASYPTGVADLWPACSSPHLHQTELSNIQLTKNHEPLIG